MFEPGQKLCNGLVHGFSFSADRLTFDGVAVASDATPLPRVPPAVGCALARNSTRPLS